MPNYTQFQGDDFITDPFDRVAADIILRNELSTVSNGYTIDHAEKSNSGYSFGGNQMDLGYKPDTGVPNNARGREIFEDIITQQLGADFFNSIKDKAYSIQNPNALSSQQESQIKFCLIKQLW